MTKADRYFSKWIWVFVLCAVFFACSFISAQSNNTRLVESSTEFLPLLLPGKENMPRALSFDELSNIEIQAIRKQLYEDTLFQRDLSGVTKYADALSGCMTWLYKVPLKNDAWQPIGFAVGQGYDALIKVNGAYREATISIGRSVAKPPQISTYRGQFSMRNFRPLADWAEYRKLQGRDSLQPLSEVAQREQEHYWRLDINSSSYAVSKRKEPCKYVDASCRKYLIKLDKLSWSAKRTDDSRAELPITVEDKFNIGVEDMCPWNLSAKIEKNEESRIFGYGSGINRNGFPKNPPLLKAIEPYIANTPRKFK